MSDTRWLSIELAVSRILDQWDELKLHFNLAATKEKCYKSQILHELYSDQINHLYLIFLKPILSDMQKVNKCFQSNKTNATELLNDLMFAINSLKQLVVPPNKEIDILEVENWEEHVESDMYQGYVFEKKIKTLNIDAGVKKEIL